MKTNDPVNHPDYYTQGGIECIDAIKASMPKDEFIGFLRGNAMKYIWRHQHKNAQEDLKKAMWYIDLLIKQYHVEVKADLGHDGYELTGHGD